MPDVNVRRMAAPEDGSADEFNHYFANFNIRVEAGAVSVGRRREIRARGWHIRFRSSPTMRDVPAWSSTPPIA